MDTRGRQTLFLQYIVLLASLHALGDTHIYVHLSSSYMYCTVYHTLTCAHIHVSTCSIIIARFRHCTVTPRSITSLPTVPTRNHLLESLSFWGLTRHCHTHSYLLFFPYLLLSPYQFTAPATNGSNSVTISNRKVSHTTHIFN